MAKLHNKRSFDKGYSEFAYASVPTKRTRRMRTNWFIQAYRWLVLNIKMVRIVAFGHS